MATKDVDGVEVPPIGSLIEPEPVSGAPAKEPEVCRTGAAAKELDWLETPSGAAPRGVILPVPGTDLESICPGMRGPTNEVDRLIPSVASGPPMNELLRDKLAPGTSGTKEPEPPCGANTIGGGMYEPCGVVGTTGGPT
mmetsp:Transcript_22955/g.42188  ORF Transcript_22955/g.42188 Transcript_22955/m.42188 type:complete len:139 (+) Transcript_22955:369-785(+)